MSQTLPKLEAACEHMFDRQHRVLVGQHPFHWSGNSGAQEFLTFPSAAEFEDYVQKNKDYAWINEIILPNGSPTRNMLGALGVELQHPRLTFDIDYELPDGPQDERFERLVSYVKESAQIVVQRFLNDFDFQLKMIDMRNSRWKKKMYKHSAHILVENVSMEDWVYVGNVFLDQMSEHWTETYPEEKRNPLDKSIYTSNRGIRVQHSRKAKGEPEMLSDRPFCETLITQYTCETRLITEAAARVFDQLSRGISSRKPLKRKWSSTDEGCIRPNHLDWRNLQDWLDTSEIARSRMWTDAQVLEGRQSAFHRCFKVGFPEKGRYHLCMANCEHRGNANQNWLVRVEIQSGLMESKCFQNGKFDLKCQSLQGSNGRWFPVVDMHGQKVRLGL